MKAQQETKTADFYAIRSIISSCMTDTEVKLAKQNPKTCNWKKAVGARISLQNDNWLNLEVKEGYGVKSGIKDVRMDESNDPEKTPFLTITYGEKEEFSFSSSKEALNLFLCGISIILKKDVSKMEIYKRTTEEFSVMIENEKKFFSNTDFDQIPPIPEEPASIPVSVP